VGGGGSASSGEQALEGLRRRSSRGGMVSPGKFVMGIDGLSLDILLLLRLLGV
jgi:hypothetical protein